MNNYSLVCIFLICIAFLGGCDRSDAGKNGQYFLKVNGFTINKEDVDAQIKFEAGLNSNFYLSNDTVTEFIQDLIQKQLLVQEAKKYKLDEKEMFRKTIQRYWESTLIRDLLADKGEQIRKSTVVTPDEINTYYEQHKDLFLNSSPETAKVELAKRLEDQKVSAKLQEWIDGLRKQATIEIKDPELAKKISHSSK